MNAIFLYTGVLVIFLVLLLVLFILLKLLINFLWTIKSNNKSLLSILLFKFFNYPAIFELSLSKQIIYLFYLFSKQYVLVDIKTLQKEQSYYLKHCHLSKKELKIQLKTDGYFEEYFELCQYSNQMLGNLFEYIEDNNLKFNH